MGWPRGKLRGSRKPKTESADVSHETYEEDASNEWGAKTFGALTEKQVEEDPQGRKRHPTPKTRGKPEKWMMKAGRNWENATEVEENPDRYHIPPSMFPEGMDLFWATKAIHGQPMPQRLNAFYRAGWTKVHGDDFDGRFASMFSLDDSGYVVQESSILCARPMEMSVRSKKREQARAREQIALKEAAFKAGEINATGADHPSAKATNRISRTLERIEIPKD